MIGSVKKTVRVGGLTWDIISTNERACTYAGRHFFACRCSRNPLWTIEEIDRPMQSGAKFIQNVARCITADLSHLVIAIIKKSDVA